MSIERKKKLCKCGCGELGYIWAKGMIKEHYLKSDTGKAKLKKANVFVKNESNKTGELELFLHIWANLKPSKEMTKTIAELESMDAIEYFEYIGQFKMCSITLEPLSIFYVQSFSHVLAKSIYKKFRLEPFNIKLVQPRIHTIYEFESRDKLLEYVGGRKIKDYYDHLARLYNGV